MTTRNSGRVTLLVLCEDDTQRRFLEALCERWGIGARERRVAPLARGRGAAEMWVRRHYAQWVRTLRAMGRRRAGLLVAVDGDRHGVERRRRQLEQALREAGLPARGADEAIALCVPTWSIETWLLWLTGDGQVSEDEPYKETPRYRRAAEADVATTRRAAEAFVAGPRDGEAERVPSLTDARREVERLPR
jgi:hypothetical protein